MRSLRSTLVISLAVALGGCEIPGMDDSEKIAAAKEAEGKAIGGACRHSGRALEDCYVMNPKALKAAVYTGWRDMDAYMRENKIDAVMPDLVDAPTSGKSSTADKKPAEEKKAGARQSAGEEPSRPATPRRFS
jgi:hypothetical protein